MPAHGIAELAHPEAGYVIVGMKSYGRAPTFLLATGYQQVRSVVAALAGDQAGALHREQGPSAAAMCARNRDLLATAERRQQLLQFGASPPIGTAALIGSERTGAPLPAAPHPDREPSDWPPPERVHSRHLGWPRNGP